MLRFLCFFLFCTSLWGQDLLRKAQEENYAIVAAILNPIEECPWSKKLYEEVLTNPHFLEKIAPVALVWEVGKEEEAIRARYPLKERPLIVILDPQGMEFARLGILPLEGEGYGEEIYERIASFQDICAALDLDGGAFEENRWQELYKKAKTLTADCYRQVILERGVKSEKGVFFHLEKYADLLGKCRKGHPELARFKEKIFKRDKRNRKGTRFQIAVLDFENRARHHKSKGHIKKNIKPLLEYIAQWGSKDSAYMWRAEKMAAEYLWSKGMIAQAMKHAQIAHEAAPQEGQGEISQLIALMQRQLSR